jgi:hypothetical protein
MMVYRLTKLIFEYMCGSRTGKQEDKKSVDDTRTENRYIFVVFVGGGGNSDAVSSLEERRMENNIQQ